MPQDNSNIFNVTFLFDKSNIWIKEYVSVVKLKKIKLFKKFNFSETNSYSAIKKQDIVFILGYTKILDKKFLKKNKLNLVCHESNLPKGKGFSPVQWQILENKNLIPIMLIQADLKIDSGKIYYKQNFRLNGSELYDEIREKQGKATLKIIKNFLYEYPKVNPRKQNGKESFYSRRSAKDSEININKNLKDQFNLLRIVNNKDWPAFFRYKNKIYNLKIDEKK